MRSIQLTHRFFAVRRENLDYEVRIKTTTLDRIADDTCSAMLFIEGCMHMPADPQIGAEAVMDVG